MGSSCWASSTELNSLLTLLFAPIIGLVGAATGFYFGEKADEDPTGTAPALRPDSAE